jgi:hypothetical protein
VTTWLCRFVLTVLQVVSKAFQVLSGEYLVCYRGSSVWYVLSGGRNVLLAHLGHIFSVCMDDQRMGSSNLWLIFRDYASAHPLSIRSFTHARFNAYPGLPHAFFDI